MSIKDKGERIFSTKTPASQSFTQNQDTKFGTCETAGVPQSVMLWQTFQGNSEAMSLALQKGEVFEKNGLYHFVTVRAGRTKTTTENQKLDGGKAKLEVADFKEMQGFLSPTPWKDFGQDVWESPFDNPDASSSSMSMAIQNKPSQLAIMDEDPVVKWAAIQKNLLGAKEAQRLLRDSGKIVAKCKTSRDEDLQQQLRQVMNQLQLSLQTCDDCQTWQGWLILVC